MIERAVAFADGVGMADCLGDIVFCGDDAVTQWAAEREIAGERGGEGAAGAVGGSGSNLLAGNFEELRGSAVARDAEEVGRRIEVSAGDDDVGDAESVKSVRGLFGFLEVRNAQTGECGGFVDVRRDNGGEWEEAVADDREGGGVKEVGAR